VDTKLLSGDSAIVTGAAIGIGRAIAEALAREGASVFMTDIAAEQGLATAAAISANGGQCTFLAADLSERDAPQRLFNAALQWIERISILVHCASPHHRSEAIFEVGDQAWEHMLAVNVLASYRLGKLLGQYMRERGVKGRMIFITSLHAETPRTVPHYSVSKAGLAMLTKELARALGPHGIRVNAIAPGWVSANWSSETVVRKISLRRIGRPEEIAGMAVALLADRFSGYVTGTTVVVDGGQSLYNWVSDLDK
jgi:3-oxoacyl-[acyl-carrier protein] reductase